MSAHGPAHEPPTRLDGKIGETYFSTAIAGLGKGAMFHGRNAMYLETMTPKQIASTTGDLAEELGSLAILELSEEEVARVSGGSSVSAELK